MHLLIRNHYGLATWFSWIDGDQMTDQKNDVSVDIERQIMLTKFDCANEATMIE